MGKLEPSNFGEMILVRRTERGIEIQNQAGDYLDPDEVIAYFKELKIEWKKQGKKYE